PRHDDALALVGHALADLDDPGIEKLSFVHPDDLGPVIEALEELLARADGDGREAHIAVRHDLGLRPRVHLGLEDLDALPGDDRAAEPADQLLALAREHAPGDDLDPSQLGLDQRHGRGILTESTVPSRQSTVRPCRTLLTVDCRLLTCHESPDRPNALRSSSKLSKTCEAQASTQPEPDSRGIPRTR